MDVNTMTPVECLMGLQVQFRNAHSMFKMTIALKYNQ